MKNLCENKILLFKIFFTFLLVFVKNSFADFDTQINTQNNIQDSQALKLDKIIQKEQKEREGSKQSVFDLLKKNKVAIIVTGVTGFTLLSTYLLLFNSTVRDLLNLNTQETIIIPDYVNFFKVVSQSGATCGFHASVNALLMSICDDEKTLADILSDPCTMQFYLDDYKENKSWMSDIEIREIVKKLDIDQSKLDQSKNIIVLTDNELIAKNDINLQNNHKKQIDDFKNKRISTITMVLKVLSVKDKKEFDEIINSGKSPAPTHWYAVKLIRDDKATENNGIRILIADSINNKRRFKDAALKKAIELCTDKNFILSH